MCFSTFLPLCWHVLWPVNWSLVQDWAFYQLWKQDWRDLKVSYFLCTAGGTGCCYTRPSHFTSSLLKAEGLFGKKKMIFNHNQLDFSDKTAFVHMQILNDRQTDWCFILITLCIVSSAAITGHDVLIPANSVDIYPMEPYCPCSVEKMRLRWATQALQLRGGTVEAETWPPAVL